MSWRRNRLFTKPLRLGCVGFIVAAAGAFVGLSIEYRPGNALAYVAGGIATAGLVVGFIAVACLSLQVFLQIPRPRDIVVLSGAIVSTVAALYGAVRVYKLWHYPEWHARVLRGDSEGAVRVKMGSPDMVDVAPRWCQPGTVRAFMYGQPFPPEWWVVGFDGEGRVACTEYLQSP